MRERVFRALELGDEATGNRRRYAAYLARRVADVLGKAETGETQAAWARSRRGWLVGDEAFRGRMARLAVPTVQGRRRDSYAGDPLANEHDEATAGRVLARVVRAWNCGDWASYPKSEPRKQVAAWLLRSRTTVGGAWIAARLAMGHVSSVSRAYRLVQQAHPPSPLHTLKQAITHTFTD